MKVRSDEMRDLYILLVIYMVVPVVSGMILSPYIRTKVEE